MHKIALPIIAAMIAVVANAVSAQAVSANKTVPMPTVNDELADKKDTDNQIITGKYINQIVSQFLLVKGVEATPSLNPSRLFRKCDGPLTVNPMFGNFQTVRVECEDVIGWRVAVRTKIKSEVAYVKKTTHKNTTKITKNISRNITAKAVKKAETARVVSLTR
ncbi:MAG: hypothetical protein HOH48_03235, partial [Candidatus Puniceispirillum sp.]|nr:hypothetical protein [Candidatus Puniceispirillum sp.]